MNEIKYIVVKWPESQHLIDHDRFTECYLVNSYNGLEEFGSCAFFVPEDIFNEIFLPKTAEA